MTLLLLSLSMPASATELVWEGYYRGRGYVFDSLSLSDSNAYAEGTSNYFDHRLLLRPSWLISEHAAIKAQIDLFKALDWGDTADTYVDPVTGETIALANADGVTTDGAGMQAIRAWGEVNTKFGRFSMGRMPMEWGSGILWNAGNGTDAEFGDSADRIQFATRVGKIFGMAAYDMQYEGFLNAPDDMEAVSLAIGYRSETMGAGLLNHLRMQPDNDYLSYTGSLWGFAELGPVRAELEGVGVFGKGNLDTGVNDANIMAFGVMANGAYKIDKLEIGAEFGVATGDDDPTDREIHTFSFDRDHNVGLFLFEETMPTLAPTVSNDTNGGRTTDAALTGDGISNAIYFKPVLKYRFLPEFQAEGSWLVAGQAVDAENGTSHGGYGNEFDLSLRWDPHPHVWAKATFGVFLPGEYYSSYEDEEYGKGFDKTSIGGQLQGVVEF